MEETNFLRAIIYGEKHEIDTFLTTEKLIKTDSMIFAFEKYMTRYELVLRTGLMDMRMSAPTQVLDIKMYQRWGNRRLALQELIPLLDQAYAFGLKWEYVFIGSKFDQVEYKCSPGTKTYLSIGVPAVLDDALEKDGGNIPIFTL